MPLESFSYITSLNSSNPGGSDGILQGDDHIRGIKSVLLASFPQINAAVTATPTVLNNLQAGTYAGAFNFSSGRVTGDGLCPSGMIADFYVSSIPTGWLELNGAAVSRTTYAALFAIYGTSFGAGDGSTTFNLPDLRGRYRRARNTPTFDQGTFQANQNASHNHTASASTTGYTSTDGFHYHGSYTSYETAAHVHTVTLDSQGAHSHGGNTSYASTVGFTMEHTHSLGDGGGSIAGWTGGGSYSGYSVPIILASNTGYVSSGSLDHYHYITSDGTHTHNASVGSESTNHQHIINGDGSHWHSLVASTTVSVSFDGGTEARPDTFVVITCVKA